VHLSLNVKKGEGVELSKQYKIGIFYPVFILINSDGDIITRWDSYYGAKRFINTLNRALSDMTTIKERLNRFRIKPSLYDALFLAKYHADIYEHLQAVEYYRQAQMLNTNKMENYYFEIFSNTANAAWNEKITFEDVLPVADTAIKSNDNNPVKIVKIVRVISNLSRKLFKTDQIEKYLRYGLDASANNPNPSMIKANNQLKIDFALYVRKDTAEAIKIKKETLGPNWENNPDKFYSFSKWCLDRKVNLEEAERYVRRAESMAEPGEFKAGVLSVLADICYCRGKTDEAIKYINIVIAQDADKDKYKQQLKKYQESKAKK